MSETAKTSRPAVVGYVEAATDAAVLGWAWCPGRPEKLTIDLRWGAQSVARSVADVLRDDLAKNGIGDGKHAFSLPVPDEFRTRARELRVFVLLEDGAAIPLDTPPAAEPVSDQLTQLQRGVEMLVGSQRVIHRNLQAALLKQAPSAAESLADIAAAQERLQESIATFELFAVRLEQALSMREPPSAPAAPGRTYAMVVGMSGIALLASCIALWRVVHGG